MREKVQRFLMGRYGFDELSRVCLWVTVAFMALSLFTQNQAFYLVGLLLLAICYFRVFSRKVEKRQEENQKFLGVRRLGAVKWNAAKARQEQKKIYRFYKCPQCRQRVRVPKGKGRICITCPKCRAEFIKKS